MVKKHWNQKKVVIFAVLSGAMAERLGTGLQNLGQRFDSASHLKMPPSSGGIIVLLCWKSESKAARKRWWMKAMLQKTLAADGSRYLPRP